MPPLHIYNNWRIFLLGAVTMPVALLECKSLYDLGYMPVLWACATAFCAVILLLCIWMLIDRRPWLTLSDVGLANRFIGVGVIAWEDIEQAYLHQLHAGYMFNAVAPQQYVCLQLRNEAEYLARMSLWNRLRWAPMPGVTRFHVNARGLQSSGPEILAHITRYLETYRTTHPNRVPASEHKLHLG